MPFAKVRARVPLAWQATRLSPVLVGAGAVELVVLVVLEDLLTVEVLRVETIDIVVEVVVVVVDFDGLTTIVEVAVLVDVTKTVVIGVAVEVCSCGCPSVICEIAAAVVEVTFGVVEVVDVVDVVEVVEFVIFVEVLMIVEYVDVVFGA